MCGLCSMFGDAGHWTEQSGASSSDRAVGGRYRLEVANAVLELFGVNCTESQGRLTLSGPTGQSVVVGHLGALWPAAEKLAGRAIDPLDPAVIEQVERLAR